MGIYKLNSFAGVSLVGFEESEPMGTGDAPSSNFRMPGGGSIDDFGTQQTFPGDVARGKNYIVTGSSDTILQTQVNSLAKLRGIRSKLKRINSDGEVQFVYARLISVGVPRTTLQTRGKLNTPQTIALDFVCETDVWRGELQGTWFVNDGEFLNDGLQLNSSLIFPITSSPEVIQVTVTDDPTEGKIPIPAVEIKVQAKPGVGFGAFKIENDSGEILDFNGVVAAGDQLVIDSGNSTIRNNGADAYSDLVITPGEFPHTWWTVLLGDNDWTITHDGIESVEITFFEYWA